MARTIVIWITIWVFVTLCLILTGNSLIVAAWLLGFPTLVGILAIPLLLLGFRGNYKRNQNLVETFVAWQKEGRLSPSKPFSPEEDKLLQMMEWRMADIQRHAEHPVIYTGGAAATVGIGAYTAVKGVQKIRKLP